MIECSSWIVEWKLDAMELRETSIMLISCQEKLNLDESEIKIKKHFDLRFWGKITVGKWFWVSMFPTFPFPRILSGLLTVNVILQRAGNFGLDNYSCRHQKGCTSNWISFRYHPYFSIQSTTNNKNAIVRYQLNVETLCNFWRSKVGSSWLPKIKIKYGWPPFQFHHSLAFPLQSF